MGSAPWMASPEDRQACAGVSASGPKSSPSSRLLPLLAAFGLDSRSPGPRAEPSACLQLHAQGAEPHPPCCLHRRAFYGSLGSEWAGRLRTQLGLQRREHAPSGSAAAPGTASRVSSCCVLSPCVPVTFSHVSPNQVLVCWLWAALSLPAPRPGPLSAEVGFLPEGQPGSGATLLSLFLKTFIYLAAPGRRCGRWICSLSRHPAGPLHWERGVLGADRRPSLWDGPAGWLPSPWAAGSLQGPAVCLSGSAL